MMQAGLIPSNCANKKASPSMSFTVQANNGNHFKKMASFLGEKGVILVHVSPSEIMVKNAK
jgi:hypothetical protein